MTTTDEQLIKAFQETAQTSGWVDRGDRQLYEMIRDATANVLPGYGESKYNYRFAEYFDKFEKDTGDKVVSVMNANTDPGKTWVGWQPIYVAKTASGKQYVIEIPHSPGGSFHDYDTSSLSGWKSLGLGDLGGEGNEKLPYKTYGSYIPLEQFGGLNEKTHLGNINPKSTGSIFDTLLTIASIIPSPIQPWAMALNAANSASKGNWIGAILSTIGANAAFSGVDSMVLADAKQLANQGLSMSQISDTIAQTYGMNQAAAFTAAVGGTVADTVGGVFDSVSGTVKDAAGNVIDTVEGVVDSVSNGFGNTGGNVMGNDAISIYEKLIDSGYSPDDALKLAEEFQSVAGESDFWKYSPFGSDGSFNAGIGTGSSSSIPDYVKDLAKELMPNGSASDIAKLAAQLIGNNMAHNSTEDIINRYSKKIEQMSPISAAEREQLGDMGMARFGKDYLTPEVLDTLANEYTTTRGRVDDQYGRLAQLYDDPMSNPLMQSVSRLTSENAARKSAAGRGLNAGSMPAEMQDALMAALGQQYGNIANPMNQTLSTLYQGQQVPLNALKTLSDMNTQAATQGQSMINTASGTQQAMSNFMPSAFQASLAMDPTRMGLSTLGSNAGTQSATGGTNTMDKIINKGVDWGLNKIVGLF